MGKEINRWERRKRKHSRQRWRNTPTNCKTNKRIKHSENTFCKTHSVQYSNQQSAASLRELLPYSTQLSSVNWSDHVIHYSLQLLSIVISITRLWHSLLLNLSACNLVVWHGSRSRCTTQIHFTRFLTCSTAHAARARCQTITAWFFSQMIFLAEKTTTLRVPQTRANTAAIHT